MFSSSESSDWLECWKKGAMVGGGVVRQKEQAKGKDKQREGDRRCGVEGTESQRATNDHL